MLACNPGRSVAVTADCTKGRNSRIVYWMASLMMRGGCTMSIKVWGWRGLLLCFGARPSLSVKRERVTRS